MRNKFENIFNPDFADKIFWYFKTNFFLIYFFFSFLSFEKNIVSQEILFYLQIINKSNLINFLNY